MGCDIHSYAEKRNAAGQWECIPGVVPFDWRCYGMYGFLAGVRNYSAVPPIAMPRGLPGDVSREVHEALDMDYSIHSTSWLTISELVAFDYSAEMEDRRVTRGNNGACTCDPGEGERMTFREFLGGSFFKDLERLKEIGAERIVFGFDN